MLYFLNEIYRSDTEPDGMGKRFNSKTALFIFSWNTCCWVGRALYPRKIGMYIDSQPKSRNSTTSLPCNPNYLRQTMLFENKQKKYIFLKIVMLKLPIII